MLEPENASNSCEFYNEQNIAIYWCVKLRIQQVRVSCKTIKL